MRVCDNMRIGCEIRMLNTEGEQTDNLLYPFIQGTIGGLTAISLQLYNEFVKKFPFREK